jgi:hypothetical protein
MTKPKFIHSASLVEALKTLINVENLENETGFLFVADSDPDLVPSDQVQLGAQLALYAQENYCDIFFGAYESQTLEGLSGFVYTAGINEENAVERLRRRAQSLQMERSDDETLASIQDILWPNGDPNQEWSAGTIDLVAQRLRDAGLAPRV